MRKPFLLYQRGPIFYYRLQREKTFHSTGKTSERAAREYVRKILELPAESHTTLGRFAEGFFSTDSAWIARQHAKGRPFGEATAAGRRRLMEKYILPRFHARTLTDLSKAEIEKWLISLPLSNQTRNHILYTFRIVLRDAVDSGAAPYSVLERVEPFGKDFRARDVFSAAELRKLFPAGPLVSIWGRERTACLFLLLATTGIRSGEARALRWGRILWGEHAILVDSAARAWSGDVGEISAKKGGSRIVPMHPRLEEMLLTWREQTAWIDPEDFIFSGTARGTPISSATVTHSLAPALKKAGIDRGDRVLVVHSFRHTFNTAMRRQLPEEVLHKLTGHHSDAMSDRYDHPNFKDRIIAIEPARGAVERLLDWRIE
jgi:integrase